MGLSHSPKIVTNGLVLALDAANNKSYPGSGTTWSDLSNTGKNLTLTNGPTFSAANLGSIVFDGTNDYIDVPINPSLFTTEGTMIIWLKNDEATPASSSNTGFIGFGDDTQNSHYPWTDNTAYLATFRTGRTENIPLSASVTRTNIHMYMNSQNSNIF